MQQTLRSFGNHSVVGYGTSQNVSVLNRAPLHYTATDGGKLFDRRKVPGFRGIGRGRGSGRGGY